MPNRTRRALHDVSTTTALALRADAGSSGKADASRRELTRLLDAPDLAQVVQDLPPESLHQLIRHCGLDACGALLESATPAQMTAIFDLDLWRPSAAGQDDQLDVSRFGEWLEALVETNPETAARIVAEADVALVVAGLSKFVRVFDPGIFEPTFQTDDEQPAAGASSHIECTIGGYLIRAAGAEAWDAIVALLLALETDHGAAFHAIMRGCRQLSNSAPEVDGLDDLLGIPEQVMYDVALDRERRRAELGYATPAEARAFLELARRRRSPWPPATTAFKSSVLVPAGTGGPRLVHLEAFMAQAGDRDATDYAARTGELAVLTNNLAAGCSIQDRAFTPEEASDAVCSTCNLGLELWAAEAVCSPADRNLVTAFELGWSAIHAHVALFTADQLLATLRTIRCIDVDVQFGLRTLRLELAKQREAGAPWQARRALEVIQMLDPPSWAALRGLLDECPAMPHAVTALLGGQARAFSATSFAFISTIRDIAQVREFAQRLPDWLAA